MAEGQSTAANAKKTSESPKYSRLSLENKCRIIQRLEAGESNTKLAQEYGVAHSAISYIKKNKENIHAQLALIENQQGSAKRTCLTETDYSPLEQGIYKWFCQKQSLGEPISGPILREKALVYNEKLNGCSTFRASNGWIQRFKDRHGIRELCMKGDTAASSPFMDHLNNIIKEEKYSLDNIYNADETGLAWKSLPRKTLAAKNETEVAGRKVLEDRVTVMACGNASGTHRIPLLVIGKSQNPRCFKNLKTLPVNYRGQHSAWIDREIFSDWYRNIFLPSIKSGNTEDNGKYLLLLDNAPSHPSAEALNSIDESCRVIFLPPNVTALIQPMDQGVIEAMKKNYKKSLLRQLLLNDEDPEEGDAVTKFLKNWSMVDCCEVIAQAWELVSSTTLRNAWNKILSPDNMSAVITDVENSEITTLINRIPGYNNFTADETATWLEEDTFQPVWHILDDDEILNLNRPTNISVKSEFEDPQENVDDHEIEEMEDSPRPEEMLKSLNIVSRWYRTRWESENYDFSALYKIRQLLEDLILQP